MSVEMKIKSLMVDPITNMPIIVLQGQNDALLPIWVGLFEANAIATEMEKVVTPRPMTHDLLLSTITKLRASVQRIVITDLRENTFFAVIHLDSSNGPVEIDARPSDAMALALRCSAPIYVEDVVLTKSAEGDDDAGSETERLRKWLEQAGPEELGLYEM